MNGKMETIYPSFLKRCERNVFEEQLSWEKSTQKNVWSKEYMKRRKGKEQNIRYRINVNIRKSSI